MKVKELLEQLTILNENNRADIYHSTPYYHAISILQTNIMRAETSHKINGKKVYGCSFTRDLNFAKNWGFRSNLPIIFDVDFNKLNQNYKITPINYFNQSIPNDKESAILRQGAEAEAEEFVIGKISNFNNYLKEILITKLTHIALLDLKNNGDDIDDNNILRADLYTILNHPKLRIIN